MEQRRLGTSGLTVSRVGLGTMTWGRDTDQQESAEQLQVFLDAGGTLVDTAPTYGEGRAEEVLGQLLGRSGTGVVDRSEVVLATKAGLSRTAGRGGPVRRVDTSRKALLDALDRSLRRLGTDTVDLWQVHTWSETAPLEETLSALDVAVSSGRVRYVGVSNYSGWQSAAAVVHQQGWPGRVVPVSTQMEYSLLQRGIEREVAPAARALGLGMLAWSPLGRGVLTGKYRTGIPADSRAASAHFSSYVDPYLGESARRVVEALCTAADGLGAAPVEVALAWVRDAPGVTAPVVGARTCAQLRGSLRAEQLRLPAEIRDALDDVSAPVLGYPDAGR